MSQTIDRSAAKLTLPLKIFDMGTGKYIHSCLVTFEGFTLLTNHADLAEALREEFNYSPRDQLDLGIIPLESSTLKDFSLLICKGLILRVSNSDCQNFKKNLTIKASQSN